MKQETLDQFVPSASSAAGRANRSRRRRAAESNRTAPSTSSARRLQSAVEVRVGKLVLPTWLPAAPDKNPMFLEKRVYQGSSGKVYPLPFTDRITEQPEDRAWKAIWIENEFLRVLVLPEIGGRIHAILDKTNGYDLIYNQPVIKPALVGLAGPWISGGIEFNWPQHHRPATFLPVNFEIEKHADGSATVWCGDHDPMCRMKGMHGVCLHPGRAIVELKVRASNRTPFVQTFLWWANVATRVHEAYQSFFPPDVHYVADHARRSMSEYPLAKGFYYGVNYGERGRKGIPAREVPGQFVPPHCHDLAGRVTPGAPLPKTSANGAPGLPCPAYAPNDLSFYANIPTPCSYMCVGSHEDFFGGYDYKAQAGLVHIADHHIAPGKKQWTWGNHEFGYAWDRNLTEPDAHGEYPPYIELMAGVYTDNQPDFSFLQPGETKTWSQYWYPIQKIGPAQHANLDAAVALRVCGVAQTSKSANAPNDGQPAGTEIDGSAGSETAAAVARLGVSVTREFPRAQIHLSANGQKLAAFTRDLSPASPFVAAVPLAASLRETDLQLRVTAGDGRALISYQPGQWAKTEVPPPATEPPAPPDLASTDELFITGLHLEQYRHATRCPTPYWHEALRRDPGDARCNNALGRWHLQRGEFAAAEQYFRRAIERLTQRNANPADSEAFYNLGLCLRFQWDCQSAIANGRHAADHTDRRRSADRVRVKLRPSAIDDRLFVEAYGAFYKATWNQAWAAAGYHALAEMDCRRGDWTQALEHLNHSLRFNTGNTRARNLKVLVLRKLAVAGQASSRPRIAGFEPAVGATEKDLLSQASQILAETLALDPLDWWARHLHGGKLECDLQTQLDLAHDYARAGFYAEAIGLLNANGARASARFAAQIDSARRSGVNAALPDQNWGALPLVHYTLGWLHEKSVGARLWSKSQPPHAKISKQFGNGETAAAGAARPAALRHYRAAAALPPDYCFPSRLEEIAILEAAMRANPRDTRAPYYLGNLLYDRRRHEEAIRLWEKSARLDPNFSIVWRNLGLGYFNIRKQPAKARAAYDRAFRANPKDARLLYERDQLWKRLGEKPAKRLRELERHPELVRQRDDLSVELCALYNQIGAHARALELIRSRNFQPWEGGEGGPLGQWVRAHLALGREALRSAAFQSAVSPNSVRQGAGRGRAAGSVRGRRIGNPRYSRLETCATDAIARFQAALTAPRNLGEARHLLANQSDIHYWLGCAFAAFGNTAKAREHWRAAATSKGDFQEMSVRAFSEMTFYSALSWERLGEKARAKKLLRELLAYAKQLQRTEAKIDYFATSLPTMLLFDDDLQFRQETTALFLQAQAHLGLGDQARAKALLRAVLKRDPNHALAADLADELSSTGANGGNRG
jgi:tetratricopeptide (TPR) repeat protein